MLSFSFTVRTCLILHIKIKILLFTVYGKVGRDLLYIRGKEDVGLENTILIFLLSNNRTKKTLNNACQ